METLSAEFTFYKLFWIFFIGCNLGVLLEMGWCYLRNGYFESRSGLVYGPLNLVYGIGAASMSVILYPLRDKCVWIIFLIGVVIGSVVEYLCSFVQEKVFGTVSWDYQDLPLNINGRICLLYSCFWGFLSIIWIKLLYPLLSGLIDQLLLQFDPGLTWITIVFVIWDTLVSAIALRRMVHRNKGISPANKVEAIVDKRFPDERMEKIYANMEFSTNNSAL